MSFKGPHNLLVTALGHSVKWPLLVSALKVKDGSGSAAIAHKPEDCVIYVKHCASALHWKYIHFAVEIDGMCKSLILIWQAPSKNAKV